MKTSLSLPHALLALAIMLVWGTNFVVIRVALDEFPPLLMAALRFTCVFVPLIFFLPRPRSEVGSRNGRDQGADGGAPPFVSWGNLAGYGLFVGVGQFGLIYVAMDGKISPGLASLVMQMQVFFTIALSFLRSGERLAPHQYMAFGLAIAGMALIVAHNGQGTTILGLVLTLGAAISWALCNQFAKEAGRVQALSYVVWSSMFSFPPLFLLAFAAEGEQKMMFAMTHASLAGWVAVLWQSVGNTMFGYGCWSWLLARHPAATVAPMALLVPVFGFAASSLWLGEPMQGWKIAAALLVMGGLAINLLWPAKPGSPPLA